VPGANTCVPDRAHRVLSNDVIGLYPTFINNEIPAKNRVIMLTIQNYKTVFSESIRFNRCAKAKTNAIRCISTSTIGICPRQLSQDNQTSISSRNTIEN
jgi:hypothetical protein